MGRTVLSAVAAALVIAASVALSTESYIELRWEPGGAVYAPNGTLLNAHGALVWDGRRWRAESFRAHTYFIDNQTGERLIATVVTDIDPDPAVLGDLPGMLSNGTIRKRLYSWSAPAVDGSGHSFVYEGTEYLITRPDTKRVLLRSRGTGLGVGQATFDIFIEDPCAGESTAAVRGDPVVFSFPGGPLEAAERTDPEEGRVFAMPDTASPYWFDVDNGSDMSGYTYHFHTSALLPADVLAENLGSSFPGDFEYRVYDPGTNSVQVARFLPALRSEKLGISAYLLPKKVSLKNGTLSAAGILDTGGEAPQFRGPAELRIGATTIDMPDFGSTLKYSSGGVSFSMRAPKPGGGKGSFKLKVTGGAAAALDPDGPLSLRFTAGRTHAPAQMTLAAGGFAFGKSRGALSRPGLTLAKARVTLAGPGRDALSLLLGFSTDGATPGTASDFSFCFGTGYEVAIPGGSFVNAGDVFTAAGPPAVTVNYAAETIAISGAGLTLDDFSQGAQAVRISVAIDGVERVLLVRMTRRGSGMKY